MPNCVLRRTTGACSATSPSCPLRPYRPRAISVRRSAGALPLRPRTNFNRDFPLIDRPDAGLLPHADALAKADQRLKARLVALSIGHDLVLDLHCDDEGVPYLYVPAELWPAMADCAAALGAEAVLTWHGYSDAAFEEASIHPYLASGADLAGRVVTTVELRGIADVERGYAKEDAEGLYRLLVARGVIADPAVKPAPAFGGVAAPLANVEMVKTPRPGPYSMTCARAIASRKARGWRRSSLRPAKKTARSIFWRRNPATC